MRLSAVWLMALLVCASLIPSWGMEPYGSAPLGLRLVLAAASGAAAWTIWSRRWKAAALFRVLALLMRFAVFLPALWILFALLRERRYIGDWINIAFSLPLHPEWILSREVLWRAPLTNLLQYFHWRGLLYRYGAMETLFAWQLLLAAYGVALVALIRAAGRRAFGGQGKSILFTALYSSSGMLYFSLGHVENYVIPMAIMASAAWASLLALRTRQGAPLALMLYSAAVFAHPQCLVFAPSMSLVIFRCYPGQGGWRYGLRCTMGLMALPALFGAWALKAGIGLSPQAVMGGSPLGALLPAREALNGVRLRALACVLAQVFPALPAVALALILWRRRLPINDYSGLWFSFNAASGLCYCLFVWNKKPMQVDWDLIGPSLLLVWMAALYGLVRSAPARRRVQVVLCLVILQLPHTALWITWNRTPDPAQKPIIESLQQSLRQARPISAPNPRKANTPSASGRSRQ